MALDSDLKNKLTYNSYLRIPDLIKLQKEESDPVQHDEMLFIIIHQAYELWFKQILHELDFIEKDIASGNIFSVLKTLKRIHVIQGVLIHQVDILETMSPTDFAKFRDHLNPASGFQSHQFRLFEYRCGLKNDMYLKFHEHDKDIHALLKHTLTLPSLYDQVLKLMSTKGYAIPAELLERDWSVPYTLNKDVLAIVHEVYTKPSEHSEFYSLFENMIELDEKVQLWRSRHVKMVERMIGMKIGTGGSAGAEYLRSTLPKQFFPELWEVRNLIGTY